MLKFSCDSEKYQDFFNRAIEGLQGNCRELNESTGIVLTEGGLYPGIWIECAPLEGLVYLPVSAEIARNNHTAFFRNQFADGQIPFNISAKGMGTAQIQQTVPAVETAYELGVILQDEALLAEAYNAWSRWDAWIARYRDSGKRNICEAFCEFDTGHDNSYRFKGLPKFCPEQDAKLCPDNPRLPYIAPDLTATMYGGRIALAKIAALFGRKSEEEEWLEKAETMRQALFQYCYDAESDFFYDRDAHGNLIKHLSDAGLRVLMEHGAEQELFERIFKRHLANEKEFWTPYPFPSVAMSDPHVQFPPPDNCWGGASQALLALRTPRWLEHYGKWGTLNELMLRWLEAMGGCPEFMQQMNPVTGEFSTSPGYSPAMCCALDFTSRLCGVMETAEGLSFGCCGIPGVNKSKFHLECRRSGTAGVHRKNGVSVLYRDGQMLAEVSGAVRVFCDTDGNNMRFVSVTDEAVEITLPGEGRITRQVRENEEFSL